jgi:tetratricopeptide (TPR) repeat protein
LAAYDLAIDASSPPPQLLLNYVAWLRATSPDPEIRDVARAVKLAKEAVRLAPQQGDYWNTLGVALCRAGEWKDALDAFEKSLELCDGGDAYDWFFIAMAQWQLGRKDEARRWYDRAVAWVEENKKADDEELSRFRTEAAALLAVQ